ncbi:hypothetical protein M2T37_27800, partial [Klebsiella pneumoniae]|uniref:hypothetical protein n=1 Tax=Klebsiella pneumoniae TaxID=573 RepID=UPI00200C13BA
AGASSTITGSPSSHPGVAAGPPHRTTRSTTVTGAAATGLSTRLVAPDLDLRGPDVAPVSLRWLATVARDAGRDGSLPSLKAGEGMGIVLVVTES